jgi:ubiquinone/menaquinone biosynthesis C-methylase UbiE
MSSESSFDSAFANYVTSSDHKEGDDLTYIRDYFRNHTFDRLLDIATGAGHFAKVFNSKTMFLTDLSYNMLKTSMSEINSEAYFVDCSSAFLPFKDASFDIAICRLGLHHFYDMKSFINETHRILKKDGLFVLLDSIVDIDDAYFNVIEYVRDTSHKRIYTLKEILNQTHLLFRLLHFNNFYKKHNFDEWVRRLNPTDEQVERVIQEFIELPEEMKIELKLEMENGKILSYTDKKGLFIFKRL